MIKIKGKFHTKWTFCRHLLTLTLYQTCRTDFFFLWNTKHDFFFKEYLFNIMKVNDEWGWQALKWHESFTEIINTSSWSSRKTIIWLEITCTSCVNLCYYTYFCHFGAWQYRLLHDSLHIKVEPFRYFIITLPAFLSFSLKITIKPFLSVFFEIHEAFN